MRFLLALLLASLLATVGCTATAVVAPPEPGVPLPQSTVPVTEDLILPAQPGLNPVETGRQLLEAGGRRWLEPPIPVLVREMPYSEARQWLPMLSEGGEAYWGAQTSVYFIIYKGVWVPTDPGGGPDRPPVTSPGCLMVLFRASDGALIAAGDSACPGQQ